MAAGDATYCVEDESSIELQDEVEAVSTPVKLEMTAESIKTYLTPTSLAQRRLQDKQLFMDMHEYDIRVNFNSPAATNSTPDRSPNLNTSNNLQPMILNFSSSSASGSSSDPNLSNHSPIAAKTSRSLSNTLNFHTPTKDEIKKWKTERKTKKIGKFVEDLMDPVENRLNNSLKDFSNVLEEFFGSIMKK
uniref:Uncharacterized protein n=1 Tax=Panagrolaimus sp. JU765 TaxID=591449 RepID=A0AC34QQ86_9BILA